MRRISQISEPVRPEIIARVPMSKKRQLLNLSRRERQIMDAVYQLGEATAVDVLESIPDPPGNASIRKLLSILEEKGYLKHRREGHRFLYSPTVPAAQARDTALRHLLTTFFKGSVANATIALLSMSEQSLSEDELEAISELIEKSKQEGR
jgi:BlaI family penicillinase repressor